MKRIWILAFALLIAVGAQAQETYRSSGKAKYNDKRKKKQENTFTQRIVAGGGLSLSLGTYTSISVSPVVGYRITDNFSAGVGFGYQYLKAKDYFEVGVNDYRDLKANMISVSAWARYLVWRNLFVHAEIERNFMTFQEPAYAQPTPGQLVIVTEKTKYQANSLLIGPGYRTAIGERSSINFALLYDALQEKYSPYGNQPFVKIQFLVGF